MVTKRNDDIPRSAIVIILLVLEVNTVRNCGKIIRILLTSQYLDYTPCLYRKIISDLVHVW